MTSSHLHDPVTGKWHDYEKEHYNEKTNEHKWYCFDCKFSWNPKIVKKSLRIIQLT